MDNILCIIPARGASKRIPRKNLIPLVGKPLIAHSIVHAQQAQSVNRIIVSTDSDDIAHVARTYNAEVIVRPPELSTDEATSESALVHVLNQVESSGYKPTLIVFLQCTSPIRNKTDIEEAIRLLKRTEADSLFSACRNELFLWRPSSDDSNMESLNYDFRHRHRDQDHPLEYRENGSIYIFKPHILKKYNNRLGGKIAVYEMDYWSSFQIDVPEQIELCNWILRRKSQTRSLFPKKPRLIVTDFDGVMTDNKVVVAENGTESVICDRGDGMGIELLKSAGIELVVLSKEVNPVVQVRCRKLSLACYHGQEDKLTALKRIAEEYAVPLREVIYVGNDINDLECLRAVGCGVAVANAHPDVLGAACCILSKEGGEGALRELSDLLLESALRGNQL